MGQSEIRTYEQTKRDYIIKDLGTHISSLGNYLQTIQEQAYDEGYNNACYTSVVQYINKQTGVHYNKLENGKFVAEDLPQGIDYETIAQWEESYFTDDIFKPTKVQIKDRYYEIVSIN